MALATMAAAGLAPLAGAPAHAAGLAAFSAQVNVPVPPASSYAGSGGGDGWAVALNTDSVFNVFHHTTVQVACHRQADASDCWPAHIVTDADGGAFSASPMASVSLDHSTNHLYTFASRDADGTGGVVCIDVSAAAAGTFCGFTALTGAGEASASGSTSPISDAVKVGDNWFAFDYSPSGDTTGAQDKLLCFSLTDHAACPSQPFAAALPSDVAGSGNFPTPSIAAVGYQVLIPVQTNGFQNVACFDAVLLLSCAGPGWPAVLPEPIQGGTPFPAMDASGTVTAACVPSLPISCFDDAGDPVATPNGLGDVLGPTSGWNGPPVVLGPRIYVPDGNADQVDCFDYNTSASCTNFPKSLDNLGLLYTVNPDPQRPSCLWVNADDGGSQIQDFDAYTGGACGEGPIRILASAALATPAQCKPSTWTSLVVTSPAPGSYTSGTVRVLDEDGNAIPGVGAQTLDASGRADLSHVSAELPATSRAPQFLIGLDGSEGTPASVSVTLNWQGADVASCELPGMTVVPGATAPSPPNPVIVPNPAQGKPGNLNIVVLGDSYSAGNGAGSYYGPTGCYRSSANWSELYKKWLLSTGQAKFVNLLNVACSGGVTKDYYHARTSVGTDGACWPDSQSPGTRKSLPILKASPWCTSGLRAQEQAISPSTDEVLFTFGGNDVDFKDIVESCLIQATADLGACRAKVQLAQQEIGAVVHRDLAILLDLHSRLHAGAHVVLLGYPQLVDDKGFVLMTLTHSRSYDVGTNVRALVYQAADLEAAAVRAADAATGDGFASFVRATGTPGHRAGFDGHEPSPRGVRGNPGAWLVQAGDTFSTSTYDHPNQKQGHPEYAALLECATTAPPAGKTCSNAGASPVVGAPVPVPNSMELTPGARTLSPAVHRSDGSSGATAVAGDEVSLAPAYYVANGAPFTATAETSAGFSTPVDHYLWQFADAPLPDTVTVAPTLTMTPPAGFFGTLSVSAVGTAGQVLATSTTAAVVANRSGDGIPAPSDACPKLFDPEQLGVTRTGHGVTCSGPKILKGQTGLSVVRGHALGTLAVVNSSGKTLQLRTGVAGAKVVTLAPGHSLNSSRMSASSAGLMFSTGLNRWNRVRAAVSAGKLTVVVLTGDGAKVTAAVTVMARTRLQPMVTLNSQASWMLLLDPGGRLSVHVTGSRAVSVHGSARIALSTGRVRLVLTQGSASATVRLRIGLLGPTIVVVRHAASSRRLTVTTDRVSW